MITVGRKAMVIPPKTIPARILATVEPALKNEWHKNPISSRTQAKVKSVL